MRILADFMGAWRLTRVITHHDGQNVQAEGQATFDPSGSGAADYVERGQMRIGAAQALTFERRYVWGADLSVYFEDGRFFHRVPPAGGETSHDCPPDLYRVTYDFAARDRWASTWDVTGPRKSYTMVTQYERAR